MPARNPVSVALQRVAGERVGVFVGAEAAAKAHDRDAMNRGHQDPKHRVCFGVGRQQSSIDDALDVRGESSFHFADETKPLPVMANRRHRSIEEHQREILGMVFAELVEAPETSADFLNRIDRGGFMRRGEQHPEALFGKRQEDVVLAWEIPINRRRAVFDFFGDFPDGNVSISLGDEQLAGGVENRPGDRLPLPFLTFFDSQPSPFHP